MGMTFDEAVAVLTGPGAPFEIAEAEVLGRPSRIFTKLPPTLRDLFAMIGERPADGVALVYEDERWTNAEVLQSIAEIATVLVERYGVQKGDRVVIDMRNYPEWITAFGAATSVGAIAVSVNAWWTGPEIEFGLVDAGAKVLVADRERIDRIGDRLAALGPEPRSRPPMSGPTMTPPSSSRRGRPVSRKGRCRPTEQSSRGCSPSRAAPRSRRSDGPPTRPRIRRPPLRPIPRASSSPSRCSTSPVVFR